jgi:alanine racemase
LARDRPTQPPRRREKEMPRPTVAEVSLDAIRSNVRALRARLQHDVRMMGIVKAEAYGHGAVPVARTLEEEGIAMLAVALVEEGVALREAGIRVPILVMGAMPADEVATAVRHNLRATVDDAAAAAGLEHEAAACGRSLAVHLKINTGMNRLGVPSGEIREAARTVSHMEHLVIEGAYTHFACADRDDGDEITGRQLLRFQQAIAALRSANVAPPMVHSANSAAVVALGPAHFNMVRPGLAVYGIRPTEAARRLDLRPALALKSRVVHISRLAAGEGVSYGFTWRAARPSIVGLLPIGYADGYRRSLSNKGHVRVAGHLCPVVGTVCMDATMIDLTEVPGAAVGLEATLIEADNDSPISAAAVAGLCGTIPYEILTGLSPRVRRVYL